MAIALALAGCAAEDQGPEPSPDNGARPTKTSEPSPTPDAIAHTVTIFMPRSPQSDGDCTLVFPVAREIAGEPTLAAALENLLAGPTAAEEAAGFGGWFTSATAGMLRDVRIEDGVALVNLGDLRPLIPNASTSCGSGILFAQLDRTVFQFPDVGAVRYRINGSERLFYEWLQMSPPR